MAQIGRHRRILRRCSSSPRSKPAKGTINKTKIAGIDPADKFSDLTPAAPVLSGGKVFLRRLNGKAMCFDVRPAGK